MPGERGARRKVETIVTDWQERRDHGEPVTPEEIIRSHPDLARELRAHFHALELLRLALERRSP